MAEIRLEIDTVPRVKDLYVIDGTKTWITNGIEGTCFGLLVKTDPTATPPRNMRWAS